MTSSIDALIVTWPGSILRPSSGRQLRLALALATLLLSAACGEAPDAPNSFSIGLVRQSAIDIDPAWSPDGRSIAFQHWRGDSVADGHLIDSEVSGIYLANTDGSDRQLLVRDAGAVAWSPDGASLLYDRFPALHIYRLDLSTGVETQLTFGDNWNRYPVWSPDGKRIAFDSNREDDGRPNSLHLMNADGSEVERVMQPVDSIGEQWSPSFSPDGQRLVAAVAVTGLSGTGLFIADTSGGNARFVRLGNFPAWSPSGDWIAYIDERRGHVAIRLVHPDGSGDHVLYSAGPAGRPLGRPGWSPKGGWVAFAAAPIGSAVVPLWALHPDGTGLHQVSFPAGTVAPAP